MKHGKLMFGAYHNFALLPQMRKDKIDPNLGGIEVKGVDDLLGSCNKWHVTFPTQPSNAITMANHTWIDLQH